MFERLLQQMYHLTLAQHDAHLHDLALPTPDFIEACKGRAERSQAIFKAWSEFLMLVPNLRPCSQVTSLRGREPAGDNNFFAYYRAPSGAIESSQLPWRY